jgi:hypothetical protein
MAWLEDWANRYQITIDGSKVDGDLVNFPLPIILSSGTGLNSFDASDIFDELSAVSGTIYSEDFTTLSGWTIVTGSGNVDSGYLDIPIADTNITSTGTVFLDENYNVSVSMKWGGSGWVWNGNIYFGYNTSTGNYALGLSYGQTPSVVYFSAHRRVAATTTTFATFQPPGYNVGYWFHHRMCRSGLDFFWKSWRSDYSEPAVWNIIVRNAFAGTEEKTGAIKVLNGSNTSFSIDTIVIDKYAPSTPKRIAITDEDGITQCPAEIEYWDPYTRTANLWTKVPTLSSGTDKIVYLYYDKSKVNNTTYVGYTGDAVAEGVWDSNFKAVYHFNSNADNTALGFKDSTSTHNHGASVSMNNTVVGGKIGPAWSFDGSDDYITIADNSTLDLVNNYTLEAVVYPTTKEQVDQIISKTPNDAGGYQLRGDTGQYSFYSGVGTTGGYAYNNNAWYYLVGTFSGTALKFYTNGYLYDSDTASTSGTPANANALFIGRRWDSWYFNGNMAEIRLSDTTRGPAWVKASYYGIWNELITYESQGLPINICSGIVYVDDSLANGITVRLYRRSTGELMDETTTSGMGNFTLGSIYEDEHYVVGLYTISGTNAIIYDWIAP